VKLSDTVKLSDPTAEEKRSGIPDMLSTCTYSSPLLGEFLFRQQPEAVTYVMTFTLTSFIFRPKSISTDNFYSYRPTADVKNPFDFMEQSPS
jgi:hypothetical protein